MIDVRNTFSDTLSEERLWHWHNLLFTGNKLIRVGSWRKSVEAMQVISGSLSIEEIHFEASPSHRVETEMNAFITWFNDTKPH